MNTYADKKQENKSQTVANEVSQKTSNSESTFQFVDNRPEAVAQIKLQEMANNSPQVQQLKTIQLEKKKKSNVPRLPPINGPSRQERPTTPRAATHAYNMAHTSFPRLTNLGAIVTPKIFGGIPTESRKTGNDIAPQIRQHEKEIREEEPQYAKYMDTRSTLGAISDTASVASTALSLTGAGATAAPIISTLGSVARIGAGSQGLRASEVLGERPKSPTGRAQNLSALREQEGSRDINTGNFGLFQVPGLAIATGLAYDKAIEPERDENMNGYVEGVRRANEIRQTSTSKKKELELKPSRPKQDPKGRSPRKIMLKKPSTE